MILAGLLFFFLTIGIIIFLAYEGYLDCNRSIYGNIYGKYYTPHCEHYDNGNTNNNRSDSKRNKYITLSRKEPFLGNIKRNNETTHLDTDKIQRLLYKHGVYDNAAFSSFIEDNYSGRTVDITNELNRARKSSDTTNVSGISQAQLQYNELAGTNAALEAQLYEKQTHMKQILDNLTRKIRNITLGDFVTNNVA